MHVLVVWCREMAVCMFLVVWCREMVVCMFLVVWCRKMEVCMFLVVWCRKMVVCMFLVVWLCVHVSLHCYILLFLTVRRHTSALCLPLSHLHSTQQFLLNGKTYIMTSTWHFNSNY